MARLLPPSDREAAWKGFGPFPAGWNLGPVGPAPKREALSGELAHTGRGPRADLPDGMRLVAGTPALAAGIHPFVARAFSRPTSAAIVRIQAGSRCEDPLLLSTVLAPGQARAVPVTEIVVGAGAQCTIDERIGFLDPDPRVDLTASTVIRAGKGARIVWRTTVFAPAGMFALLHRHAILAEGAELALDLEVAGAGRVRVSSTQTLRGAQAVGRMATAVRVSESARYAHAVLQDVRAPGCVSRMNERVVVDGLARSVFAGSIYLAPQAQRADSSQTHRALLLSDGAASDATPSLEIRADDVRCSHGATTSRLDPEQRFYLLSRGIPEAEATVLLVDAFLAQAGLAPLSSLPVPAAA